MDNLVFINESNDVLTDSLRVAVKFEKDHSKVIRSIDDLLEKSYVIDTECNPKMDLHKMFCLCYDDIPQPNGGFRKSKRYVMNAVYGLIVIYFHQLIKQIFSQYFPLLSPITEILDL